MRKLLGISICAVFVLLIGCANGQVLEDEIESDLSTSTNKAESTTHIIIDQNGNEVVIPKKIKRLATGRILPFPAVYFLATGQTDEIVGMHPASMSAAKTSMLGKIQPGLLNANTGFIKGSEINIEELLALETDVVFAYGDNGHKLDVYSKAGIVPIAIRTMSIADGNSIETLNSWLELLGSFSEEKERAQEIIDYGRSVEQDISKALVNEGNKPRGLMIFTHTDGKTVVSGKGFFGNYWLEATGAVDVAEEIKIKAPVDMEQIYTWNPEIIYISNFTDLQPEDFYQNTIPAQDWSEINAVKNKRVHKIPLGIYRWFPPSGDSPLMLKWLAQKNHPEIFTYDFAKELGAYYEHYYDYRLSDKEIDLILHPTKLSSEGY